MQRRMRAAIAALPFEHPKLAVVASMDAGPGFAARLEAAIERFHRVLDAKPQSSTTEFAEISQPVSLSSG